MKEIEIDFKKLLRTLEECPIPVVPADVGTEIYTVKIPKTITDQGDTKQFCQEAYDWLRKQIPEGSAWKVAKVDPEDWDFHFGKHNIKPDPIFVLPGRYELSTQAGIDSQTRDHFHLMISFHPGDGNSMYWLGHKIRLV